MIGDIGWSNQCIIDVEMNTIRYWVCAGNMGPDTDGKDGPSYTNEWTGVRDRAHELTGRWQTHDYC